jgi:hypothetical protein
MDEPILQVSVMLFGEGRIYLDEKRRIGAPRGRPKSLFSLRSIDPNKWVESYRLRGCVKASL